VKDELLDTWKSLVLLVIIKKRLVAVKIMFKKKNKDAHVQKRT
jgi:hypothetical protein